jgi:alpha-tubulin suppressor-like RCC1 family protein
MKRAWLVLGVVSLAWGCVERGEVLARRIAPTARDDAAASVSEPNTADADAMAGPAASASNRPQPSSTTDEPSREPDAATAVDTTEQTDAAAAQTATAISAGAHHSCAVFTSGIACWGSNASGQLGLGDALDRNRPTLIADTRGALAVLAAGQHSCAVDAAGAVWCWGANDRGQLATGDRLSRPAPTRVTLPGPAVQLAARFNHSCALLDDAALYCWGENFEGQLGQADSFPGEQNVTGADALRPLEVAGSGWLWVDAGQGHSCAIAADFSLWCWGRNTDHQLGAGTDIQIRAPQRVDDALDWAQVSTGQGSSCATKGDGSLWCWGRNIGFDTADGSPLGLEVDGAEIPTRVSEQDGWSSVSTRSFHSCGLRDQELWCWGRAIEGQLGLDDPEIRNLPTLVGSGYFAVSAGPFTTCVITVAGSVQCAGENDQGELGTGDVERRSVLTAVLRPVFAP